MDLKSHSAFHKTKGYILPLEEMSFTRYSHSRLWIFFHCSGIVETVETDGITLLLTKNGVRSNFRNKISTFAAIL